MLSLLASTFVLPLLSSTVAEAAPHDRQYVAPSSYLHVENRTPARGELYVDGMRVTTLDPREDMNLRLAYGSHKAQFRIGGHVAMSREVYVDGRNDTFVVDVALEGNLVVRNPLPISVVLSTPRGGYERRVEPYGSAYFQDVSVGSFTLSVSRPGGDQLTVLRPEIRAFDTTRVEIPMPRVGTLEIRSDDWRTMVVSIDGRMERQFEHTASLDVSTGRHRVDVRSSSGRIVLSQYVMVEPFDIARVRIDAVPDAISHWDGHDDRDDDRNDDDRGDDHGNHGHDGDTRR